MAHLQPPYSPASEAVHAPEAVHASFGFASEALHASFAYGSEALHPALAVPAPSSHAAPHYPAGYSSPLSIPPAMTTPPPRPRRGFWVRLPGEPRAASGVLDGARPTPNEAAAAVRRWIWEAAWRGFSERMLRRWRDAPRLVIGSGGAHGALLLGGVAAVVGGWGDAHVRRWLARRPRSLAGVSAGCIGALGLALGLGPLRLAAMNLRFPYADVFGSDLPELAPPTGRGGAGGLVAAAVHDPAAVVRRLAGIPGLLRGISLRTVVRTLLAEAALPDSLTFAQLQERTGPGVEVRVLAVSLSTLRLVTFSARTSPDVRVADAMVASMSIPGVFAPVHIPGWGPCVDGGVLDPLGLEAFAGEDGVGVAAGCPSTVWVGKAARFEPSRRADSIPSVLLSCLAACAQHTQRLNQERRTGRGYGPAMVSVSLGVREGCDERDVAVNAFDLLRPPPVAGMLRDGLESADGCVFSAFLLLILSAAAAARSGAASPAPEVGGDGHGNGHAGGGGGGGQAL